MTIVFKVSDNVRDKLIKYYEDLRKEKTPPYAVFQAQEADTTITLYESGKVMFQGISADIDANIWIDLERRLNNRIIDITTGKDKTKKEDKDTYNYNYTDTLGSDEVGTGDFFGPMVVTAAYVRLEDQDYLRELKVGDSKKITDAKIMEIAPLIIKRIVSSTFVLNNKQYNENYSKEVNMNKIKAILHNKALLAVIDKGVNPSKIVVDQFENKNKYYEHLNDVPKTVTNITFATKAEDKCLSVACASIISRYVFIKEMEKISSMVGLEIPKGAGPTVDEVALKIAKDKGVAYFENIAKLNFSNYQKVKDAVK